MRVQISKNNKNILIITLVIMLLSISYLAYRYIYDNAYKKVDKIVLDYSINPEVSTKVFLNNNTAYSSPYLTDNKLIVNSLINYLESDFSFKMASGTSNKMNISVDSYLMLESFYGDKKELLWSKMKPLDKKVLSGVNEIKYAYTSTYDLKEAKTFLDDAFKQMELNPQSTFSMVWKINGEVLGNNNKLLVNKEYKVNIPISEKVFKLEKVNFKGSSDNITKQENVKIVKPIKIKCLWFALILAVIIALIFVTKVQVKSEKIEYEKKKERIFKEYADRFAKLDKSLHNQYANIINMYDIADMVRISDEIRQPIFYYEVDEEDEKKIEYFVFDDGRMYYLVNFAKIDEKVNDFIEKNN